MEAPYFTEADFYLQQQLSDRRWKLASIVAVAFHLSLFASALYLPAIIDRKPLIEEVITVDLLSMPEPAEVTPPTPPPPEPEVVQAEPQPPKPEPPPVAPEVVVTPEPIPPPPVVKAKPISIKPVKRKIKKANDTRLAEEKQREKKIAQQKKQAQERRQAIARAREQEQRALEEAQRAREALASVIRETQAVQPKNNPQRSQPNTGRQQVMSLVEQQYYTQLTERLRSYWVPPQMRNWGPDVVAEAYITIGKRGEVLDIAIAKKSSDPFFDTFVKKSIRSAAPMPPIPKLIGKSRLDFALTFRPAGLSM